MAVAELTETTTPEEIRSIVDDIHAERTGEQAKPESNAQSGKTDAEIVSEVADIEVPAPSKGDDSAPAPVADSGKKGKGEAEDRSWLDDDLKAEVSAFGISEDELADFSSREEVERAMRLFDKSALEAGRKAMAEGDAATAESKAARDDKGRFTKTETPAVPAAEKPARTGGYEIGLTKDVYDDALVDELTRMRDHYEDRLEVLEARFREADQRAEEQQFDSLVDSLGHADLFGKTDKETAQQLERRKDLHVAVKAQMLGLQALGRPTELSESLINRVARMVFAEELGKKDLKSRTVKVTRQSNSRQGGGATRPTDVPEHPRDMADRLFRELAGQT